MSGSLSRDKSRFCDHIMSIDVPKAHFISIPKGDVNHQREQALIPHGTMH